MTAKLVLYSWGTPNGKKPILLLEELGVPYELIPIDLRKGAQKEPEYRKMNPNQKIPLLKTEIDGKNICISESAAILVHLSEEHDCRFFSARGPTRARVMQWLFFQMSAIGPTLGQLSHWRRQEPKNETALERYRNEGERVYGVIEQQLSESKFLAGDEYTLADINAFFWIREPSTFGLDPSKWPHVMAWAKEIEARPAAQRVSTMKWS